MAAWLLQKHGDAGRQSDKPFATAFGATLAARGACEAVLGQQVGECYNEVLQKQINREQKS
jgi:hypothetical protein